MKIIIKILSVAALFILMASSFIMVAYADSPIEVDSTSGNDATCSGTSPCKTIQKAVDIVDDGGLVIVHTGTYTENVTITRTVTISGAGTANTTIDGNASGSVFDIDSSAVVTITRMAITNGQVDLGGGILNQGMLVLSDTIVTGNTANWDGGGIYNQNTLTIISSTISSNLANGAGSSDDGVGGGIANSAQGADATLTINQSSIIDNTANGVGGGGISNSAGASRTARVTLNQTIVSGNVATATSAIVIRGFGGGIRNSSFTSANSDSEALLLVYNSTIKNNTAFNGGGIGSGTLTNNEESLNVYLENSTVSGNMATDNDENQDVVGNGGGLVNQNGTTTLVNSTVSDNTADGGSGQVSGWGGGIINIGSGNYTTTLWLTNTTVASNTAATGGGDGVANVGGEQATVANFNNTIIAYDSCSNTVNSLVGGSVGTLASQGYNLEYNTAGSNTCNLAATTDITGTDPSLGPLQNNGGNTKTHALSANSPAIDTGDCVLLKDQRGQGRPNSVTPFCDIGAYESSFAGVVDLEMSKTVTPTEVTAGDTITYTLTFTNNGLAPVTGVVITDIVPTELTDLTVSNSGAVITATPGYTYSWTVEDLWRGDGGVITITGRVISGTASGPLVNTATITTTNFNPDSDIDNNEGEATVTVGGSGSGGPGPIFLPIILKNTSS